ncbi:GYF domain-containing protein [Elusimicrobiota bacterium]
MKKWFAYINRKLHGPYTLDQLKTLKELTPDTEVTESTYQFWQSAKKVRDLADIFKKPAAVAPAPAAKPDQSAKFHHCPECGVRITVKPGYKKIRCEQCGSSLIFDHGIHGKSPLVSLDCPKCGATIEIPEDSNTFNCDYCDSHLLIAGEHNILRFYIEPRVTHEQAVTIAKTKPTMQAEPSLVFVPYWRYKAMIFLWEIGTSGVGQARKFNSRSLDASIRALEVSVGYGQLGTRLKLTTQYPFDRKKMESLGEVRDVTLTKEKAVKILADHRAFYGMRDHSLTHKIEHGNVVGGKLSLVYFPFWSCGNFSIDALNGDIIPTAKLLKTSSSTSKISMSSQSSAPKCVPLRCPRCGNDLDVQVFQKIYFCEHCQLGWQSERAKLAKVSFKIAAPEKPVPKDMLHIPLWKIRVEMETPKGKITNQAQFRGFVPGVSYTQASNDPDKPFYIYVPAWGNRLCPQVSKLAKLFTKKQPEFKLSEDKFKEVTRSIFGPVEAQEMAFSVLLGTVILKKTLIHTIEHSELIFKETELILVPSFRKHREIHDACIGLAVHQNEMKEAAKY